MRLSNQTLTEIRNRIQDAGDETWERAGNCIRIKDGPCRHIEIARVCVYAPNHGANAELLAHAKADIRRVLTAYEALLKKAEPAIEIANEEHIWCESCGSWCAHEDFIGSNCGDYEGFCIDCYDAAEWECESNRCRFRALAAQDFDGTCPECGSALVRRGAAGEPQQTEMEGT